MVESSTPSPAVLPDVPAIEDKLGFKPYAFTLRDIILSAWDRPLTIGIFGTWGSGKTSLMKMIDRELKQQLAEQNDPRQIFTVEFNAWLYSKEEALWRALIVQVLACIGRYLGGTADVQARLNDLAEQLYRAAGPSELGTLSITAADLRKNPSKALLTLGLQRGVDLLEKVGPADGGATATEGAAVAARALHDQVRQASANLEQERFESLDQFREEFRKLVEEFVVPNGQLVVYVDDLDRCLPEKAVEVLEAIKLFLDVPGCVFILAIDEAVVERGIRLRYGELGKKGPEDDDEEAIDGRRYLEKIIQIPFVLPPISSKAMGAFIGGLEASLPHPECGLVFARGLEPNPRQAKRAINIFSLLYRLSSHKSELLSVIKPVRLAKVVVIQQRHPDVYELLRERPTLLIDLETHFRQQHDGAEFAAWESKQGRVVTPAIERPPELADYNEWPALSDLLTMHPLEGELAVETNFVDLTVEEAEVYIYLTRSIKESVAEPEPAKASIPPTPPPTAGEQIESGLDERTLGYLLERAYVRLEKSVGEIADGPGLSADQSGSMLQTMAEAGSELYLQIFREPATRDALQTRLGQPTNILTQSTGSEMQVPWEMIYDRPLGGAGPYKQAKVAPADAGPVAEGFWGFRHVVARPLLSNTLMADESVAALVHRSPQVPLAQLPRVGLIQSSREGSELRALLEEWQQAGRLVLRLIENVDDFLQTMRLEGPDIVILQGEGRADASEVLLPFGPETMYAREFMARDDQRGSSTMLQQAGPAIFCLDLACNAARSPAWLSWLEIFGLRLGGLNVIAPLVAPDKRLAWSWVLLREFLELFLGGESSGEALRQARLRLWEEHHNPLGLLYAQFGRADVRLAPQQAQTAQTAA